MTAALPISPPAFRYRTELARTRADVEAAQRLRFDVFARECGARLRGPRAAEGLDADEWDDHCDHLLVRDERTDAVVGTYRLLPPDRAAGLGGGYSDGEFDLSRHAAIRPALVEAGRSCVHPDHRTGAVVGRLWAGVVRYVRDGGYSYLGGCASVSLSDGGATAAGVWDVVRQRHLAPAALRVVPHVPFDVEAPVPAARPLVPPLLRAYLRLGAHVCGRPALDADFGTADLYVLLRMADIDTRVLRRLTAAAGGMA
ncbi:GNAT family N-acyltransferase [Blastococcus sp. TF02A_35]|uniref:GNAT family N-acetyltransferase n=1 Tax=Blastococcus sp. TF02A-35 TaxID=2559612 RepID=UPI001073C768|nr:GNAT family N-acyltransferase [Blastococcus sp. TF02A_35]TFV48951.1 GNAT family N-acetyltransferase [Blastococcus sp. TF02A_35]